MDLTGVAVLRAIAVSTTSSGSESDYDFSADIQRRRFRGLRALFAERLLYPAEDFPLRLCAVNDARFLKSNNFGVVIHVDRTSSNDEAAVARYEALPLRLNRILDGIVNPVSLLRAVLRKIRSEILFVLSFRTSKAEKFPKNDLTPVATSSGLVVFRSSW